jgi:hypothetical protein
MYAVVAGLLAIVGIVFYQVFGRYVLNNSPTWTENLALVLVLYVTLIAAAVGSARRRAHRDGVAAHAGAGPPARADRAADPRARGPVRRGHGLQRRGARPLGRRLQDREPRPVGGAPLPAAGDLGRADRPVLVEHIIALLRGREVLPAWH